MKLNLSDELLEKAKGAKNHEELIVLAKENGIELTNDDAVAYFAKLNAKDGELGDDELGDAAGGRKCGTTYREGRPLVSGWNSCEYFQLERDGERIPYGANCADCAWSEMWCAGLYCFNPERLDN